MALHQQLADTRFGHYHAIDVKQVADQPIKYLIMQQFRNVKLYMTNDGKMVCHYWARG